RSHQCETSTLLLGANTRGRTRCCGCTRGARPAGTRSFILVGLKREPCARAGARNLFAAEAFLGNLASLTLGLFVVLAAIFFLALAFFGLAHARVGERVRARITLFVGQSA